MGSLAHAAVLVLAAASCAVVGCGASSPASSMSDGDDGHPPSRAFAPVDPNACDPSATPPTSTLVVDRPVWNLGVAADATSVYFRTFGPHTVWKVPRDGSAAATKLWSGAVGIFGNGMAVDAHYVYWTGVLATANGIMRVSTDGGDGKALALLPSRCAAYGGVAVDATRVYAATVLCRADVASIASVPIDGGTADTLWSSSRENLGGFALTDDAIVFTTSAADGTGAVRIVAKTGGEPRIIAASPAPSDVAVLGDRVFWIDGSSIMTAPLAGGAAVRFATAFQPSSLAVDPSWVYVALGGTNAGDDLPGRIVRIPAHGGPAQDLAHGIDALGTITVDRGALFWSTLGAADADDPVRHAGVFRFDLCD